MAVDMSIPQERVLTRMVASAVYDEPSGELKKQFENPSIPRAELEALLSRDYGAKIATDTIQGMITEGIIVEEQGTISFNVKKGLFHRVYTFLFSDRSFLQKSVDGFHYKTTLIVEFYHYMVELESKGVVQGFSIKYPKTTIENTASQEYNRFYKAVSGALDKCVAFGFLLESKEGGVVKYSINRTVMTFTAPLAMAEKATHTTLEDLGIFSTLATELSLHNVYMVLRHKPFRWREFMLWAFPRLVGVMAHLGIPVADENGLLDLLRRLHADPALRAKLFALNLLHVNPQMIVAGDHGWYYALPNLCAFSSHTFRTGGEITVKVFRGLKDPKKPDDPRIHVMLNQEREEGAKVAIPYSHFLSRLDWLDEAFFPAQSPFFDDVLAGKFTMSSVEYNIDLFLNDEKYHSVRVNEMNRQIAVSTFKILLRVYDLTNILAGAIKAGKLGNFSSLGDVTRLVDSGIKHFVRFEQRSTERVQVEVIKSFLKRRATSILQGATHKTIIDALLGIEGMSFHQSEHAKMLQRNEDRMYEIQMGQAFVKAGVRNIANTLDTVKESAREVKEATRQIKHDVTTLSKGMDQRFSTTESAIGSRVEAVVKEVEKKLDAGEKNTTKSIDNLSTRINQAGQQITELGNDFTAFGTRMDGVEGELLTSSTRLGDVQNEVRQSSSQVLAQVQQIATSQSNIETYIGQQTATEQARLEEERKRRELEEARLKEERKRREADEVRALEAERVHREALIMDRIKEIKSEAIQRYGGTVADGIADVLASININLLSLIDAERARKNMNAVEKMLRGCIVKKPFGRFELRADLIDMKAIRYS